MICTAQSSYYNYFELGQYAIGFYDTVIYDNEIQYDQYGSEGAAPIFLQIWFPIQPSPDNDLMRYGEFKNKNIPQELIQTYQELSRHVDEIFIRDGVEYDILTDEPIDYGDISKTDILDQIKALQTKTVRSQLELDTNFPVIVYHHGSQGFSQENSIMAEYFASRGYIFISANYHLPYPNTLFGLLPFDLEKVSKHNQSSVRKVINFSKSITINDKIYFVGHSWGAQEGWCFLHDSTLADAFVSIETTIEFKKDSAVIIDRWPYVYDAIKVKKNKFSIPILLIAAADEDTNFDFFKGLSSEEMIYASYKELFAHNSYTSFYMMRYFLSDNLKQNDSEVLLTQIKGYIAHLELIDSFLRHINNGESFEQKEFEELFLIPQN